MYTTEYHVCFIACHLGEWISDDAAVLSAGRSKCDLRYQLRLIVYIYIGRIEDINMS